MFPNSNGIMPYSLLVLISNSLRFVNLPNCVGKVPRNWLLLSVRVFKVVNILHSFGMVYDKRLLSVNEIE
jgi:hypothetical protein